jgi:hypothetical protein
MAYAVENRGLAPVNKSFVSHHKKELLLVAGLVASVALGLLVSPDLGIGMGAVVFFTYLSADLLSPSTTPRKNKQNHEAWDEWDVDRRVATKRRSSVSEAPKVIVEAKQEDLRIAAAKAAREEARREKLLKYARPERPTRYAYS